MLLKLTNNLTKKVYEFDNLDDKLTSRIFYTFDIQLTETMDEGEYSYDLYDEEGLHKASGLLQIGDYRPENKTYSATTTESGYIQYNG